MTAVARGPDPATAAARAAVTAFYDAANAGDHEGVLAVCAEDVVYVVADGRMAGHADLLAYSVSCDQYFPGRQFEWRISAAGPDGVACEYRVVAPPEADWQLSGSGCSVFDIEDGRITAIRDFQRESEDSSIAGAPIAHGETITLAQEQAALRRVAALLASDPDPNAVFTAISEEVGSILAADATALFRFFDDDTMQLVAAWSPDDATFPVGDRRPMNAHMLELRQDASVQRFPVLPESSFLEEARDYGITSAVGVPLQIEDDVWGVLFATSRGSEPFPPDAESRVLRFTALAGILLSHARSQEALAASRARVLAAADESRRRVQRDLHDGAQQRLVHAIIVLEMAQKATATHECAAASQVEEALRHARRAQEELRDLARGILPATLTRRGLRAALEAFADDLPLDLRLEVEDRRFPAALETAAYFVVAEAVTNVLKHSGVDRAEVAIRTRGGGLEVEVRDEGPGGARLDGGTGLRGLADRLDASGGRLHVVSPPGEGTTVTARLPLPVA